MPGRVDELAAAFANYAQVRGGNSGRQGRARPQEKLRLDVDATSLRRQPDLRADQARSNSPSPACAPAENGMTWNTTPGRLPSLARWSSWSWNTAAPPTGRCSPPSSTP